MTSKHNAMLHPIYPDAVCKLCGYRGKPGELNIEGSMHHKSPVTCIDTKACRRRRKKR